MKYFGLNHKHGLIEFPSPDWPSCGYGPKYILGVEKGKYYYINPDNSKELIKDKEFGRDLKKFVKNGSWAQFPKNPYKKD